MTDAVVLAGGGTGGHVFPLLAVAEALRDLAPKLRLIFVGTKRGLERRVVPDRGFELRLEEVLPLVGGGARGAVRGAFKALDATRRARTWLAGLAPRAVLSIGGYAAGPVSLAARTLGVPLALIEPNSVLGLANRLLAPLVQRAYLAFSEVERHFASGKVVRSGVPIRSGFEPRPFVSTDPLEVLVLGGSQGAAALNATLPRAMAALGSPLSIVHQAGPKHAGAVKDLYESLGTSHRVSVLPFIDDMPEALASASLVISRSGASAVSEICAVGRPALLVPYPHAAGNHQLKNARALATAGAAVCVPAGELDVERARSELERLIRDPSTLAAMAGRAAALSRPGAAVAVARDLLSLSGGVP